MIRRPPRSTRTDTLCPYTTLFRSTLDGVTHPSPSLARVVGGVHRDRCPQAHRQVCLQVASAAYEVDRGHELGVPDVSEVQGAAQCEDESFVRREIGRAHV